MLLPHNKFYRQFFREPSHYLFFRLCQKPPKNVLAIPGPKVGVFCSFLVAESKPKIVPSRQVSEKIEGKCVFGHLFKNNVRREPDIPESRHFK